ncbi:MAG: hypothetical protein ACYTGZ_10195 [Planctomycetota bacterium]|jgi:hypothetical protein
MWDWIHEQGDWLAILGAASAIMLVASVIAVPWFVLRLPADALRRPNPLDAWGKQHPILRVLVIIGRNAVGIPLLLVGIALSVPLVPGQGILTILLALLIMEFPGKWRLEHRFLGSHLVLGLLNWIRRKGHKEPLLPLADQQCEKRNNR